MADPALTATAREALAAIRARRPAPPAPPPKPAYVIVRTWEAHEPTVCGGARCSALIPEGGAVTLVYHEARFRRDPDGRDVQALLCSRCVESLGPRARPLSHEPLRPLEPFSYRGKPVPAF